MFCFTSRSEGPDLKASTSLGMLQEKIHCSGDIHFGFSAELDGFAFEGFLLFLDAMRRSHRNH